MDGFDIPVGVHSRTHRLHTGDDIEFAAGGNLTLRLHFIRLASRELSGRVRLAIATSFGQWEQELAQHLLLADVTSMWKHLAFDTGSDDVGQGFPSGNPLVHLRRCGLLVRVFPVGHDLPVLVDTDQILHALERVGHGLAARLPAEHPLVENWRMPAPRTNAELRVLQAELLGVTPAVLPSLGVPLVTSVDELIYPDDLQAVARRVQGRLSADALRSALHIIGQSTPTPTDSLDELGECLRASVPVHAHQTPREHGNRCAAWLCNRLGLAGEAVMDVEAVVRSLGVEVKRADLGDDAIDAMAAWGSHGPVILLNLQGRCSRSHQGAQAIMAHQLCHMLLDREREMPVCDVYGCAVKTGIACLEQRADAFASAFSVDKSIGLP